MSTDSTPPRNRQGFADAFGRLILLLRKEPGNTSGQEAALAAAVAALASGAVTMEAGVEQSWGMDDDSLKARLLARGVDTIRIETAANPEDLRALARTLTDENAPFVDAPGIRVELIPRVGTSPPLGPSHFPIETTAILPPRPQARTSSDATHTLEGLVDELTAALQRGNLLQALHDIQGVIRMLPAVPEESRRGFAIIVRRALNRPVVEQIIQLAFRVQEEQNRAVEVLRWAGLDAAELMLEMIRQSESVGPRGFLFEALGGMPEALPLMVPLLSSERWHDVRHGADLLGRLGVPGAIELLRARINHPDERVRLAVIDALGQFKDKVVVESLRQALTHPSPRTRAQAGRALARRRSGAMAMPLLAALGSERDPLAWKELLVALAQIDSPESAAALARLATEKKALLGRGGLPIPQRLEVVEALAQAGTVSAHLALERVAHDAEGVVREAAKKAIGSL